MVLKHTKVTVSSALQLPAVVLIMSLTCQLRPIFYSNSFIFWSNFFAGLVLWVKTVTVGDLFRANNKRETVFEDSTEFLKKTALKTPARLCCCGVCQNTRILESKYTIKLHRNSNSNKQRLKHAAPTHTLKDRVTTTRPLS